MPSVADQISQLEAAIVAQEALRSTLGDSVVELTVAALRKQLAALQTQQTTVPHPQAGLAPGQSLANLQRSIPKELAEKMRATGRMEGERRWVTVLFADVSGLDALGERLDPEEVAALTDAALTELAEVVYQYEGYVDKFVGDAIMAVFGAPIAHEDDPERTLRAALAMRDRLEQFNRREAERLDQPLALHAGINTGLVVAGNVGSDLRMTYTVMGDTVNTASRLRDAAQAGEILVGTDTYRLTTQLFDFQALEPLRVKGKARPVHAYLLLGARTQREPKRGLQVQGISSPLVGRDREWAAFMHNVERLLAGHGGLVSIIGEAGLGKSRLLAEVRQHVADRQLLWREGRALSFSQGISYSPFLQIIRSDAGIAEDDGDAESWAKLERRITALFPAQVAEILPYLATLLALTVRGDFAERVRYLDGDAMRRQIFRSARRFFERLAQERPLVLVFEDLHWADPSSVELLEHLLPLIREVPLLICGISRPDLQAPAARLWTIAAQAYRDRYTPIVLSPLSPADSAQLLHNLLAIDDLPPRYRELILGKAEGNPLFVEEVIRALIDLGAVVQQPETRRWQVTTQVEQITIPDTLQGVIMARVDRLPEEAKQVLKLAAVIGRSFYYRVLQNIAEMDGVLAERLAELQRLEMIREKARAPELEYIFKHVLVQEAAYESILVHRRRELHYCVAQGIETLFAGRVEEFYGLLAYHYARAEDWEKAQEYLFKTGDQAGRIAADAEALGHYQQAIAAYTRAFGDRWDPFQRAVLERKIGEALFRRGEHVQAVEYMQRALAYLGNPFPASRRGLRLAIVQQLVRQIGHRLLPGWLAARMREVRNPAAEEQAHIFHVMSWIDYFVDPERLLLDVLLMLNLSEQSGIAPGIVQGSMGMGLIGDQIPAPRLARYYHRRAVALAEQIRQPVALGLAYLGLGLHEHSVGEWTAALEHYERAATIYWEAGELRAWGATTSARAWLLGLRGEVTSSRSLGHELVRVGQDGADRQVCGFGSQALGRIMLHAGALEEANDHLRDAVESFRAVSDYRNVASAGGDLGLCYLRQGKLKQALEVMVESNRLLDERNLRGWFSIAARNALAEGYLVLAEEVEGAERAAALQKARRACRAAMQQGRLSRDGLPGAYRLRGAYEWLSGQPAAARHWWQRSLAVAQKLGARYDLGLTYLEMGKRMGDTAHLQRADAILGPLRAAVDLESPEERQGS